MRLVGASAERFEQLEVSPRGWDRAIERATGRWVNFLEPEETCFLDRAAMRSAIRVVQSLDDPRVAHFVCDDPAAVYEPQPEKLEPAVAAELALELLLLAAEVARHGLRPVYSLAQRRADRLHVPLAPAIGALHYLLRHRDDQDALAVGFWARERGVRESDARSPRALAGELAAQTREPSAAMQRAAAVPWHIVVEPLDLDFDAAIADGERELARIDTAIASASVRPSARPYASWALAAALHHRACVRDARGAHDESAADLSRAIEIDPHPRYLTTRALFAERWGDDTRARADHDAAIARLAVTTPTPGAHGILVLGDEADFTDRARADGARTRIARGAWLARHGDRDGARRDFEAAMPLDGSGLAGRWLASLAR